MRFDGGNTFAEDSLKLREARCIGGGVGLHLAKHVAQGIKQRTSGLNAHVSNHGGIVFDSGEK